MENLDKVTASFFVFIGLIAVLFVIWSHCCHSSEDIKPQIDDQKFFGSFRFLDGEKIVFPTKENFIGDNLLLLKTTLGRTVLMPNPGTGYVNGEHAGIVLDEGDCDKIRKYFSKDSTEPVFTNNEVNK